MIDKAELSHAELGALQQILISSVLTGSPLPGASQPASLPDLDWVLRQPEILLSDEDLMGNPSVDSPSRLLRIVTASELKPGSAYLQLSHSGTSDSAVTLRMEVRVASAPGTRAALLSSIMVMFRHEAGQWIVPDEPVMLAD